MVNLLTPNLSSAHNSAVNQHFGSHVMCGGRQKACFASALSCSFFPHRFKIGSPQCYVMCLTFGFAFVSKEHCILTRDLSTEKCVVTMQE